LKLDASDALTTRCPFCATEVVLPEDLRPVKPPVIEMVTLDTRPSEQKRKGWPPGATILLAIALIVAGAVVPNVISNRQAGALAAKLEVEQTGTARAVFFAQTAAATATPLPTPTPQYAEPVLTFGESGNGEGMFTRASYIAVDGKGNVYTADYEGGKVQRFNAAGEYLSQWRFGDSKTNLHGLSASFNGDVYLAYDQVIEQYDGASGKLLNQISHPEGGEFGDLAVNADGSLAAVWYEGRWGLITSIEGHREELDLFSPEGELVQAFPNFISAQTESLALDVNLAVDGAGTIYALSDSVIFQFSPEGKFLDRIDHLGDGPGQYRTARTLAVDGKGRIYVVDGRNVYVYAGGQQFVDVFSSPEFLNALAIDRQGGIWGAANEQVLRFERKERP
jgi:streptogramin lyase